MELFFSDTFLWAQILGAAAMTAGFITWQLKTPKNIMLTLTVTDILWSVQYFLLGATIGGFMTFGASIRNFCAAYLRKSSMKYVVMLYVAGSFIITYRALDAWYDILPFIGTVIFSTSLLYADNRIRIARANLLSGGFWTVYAILSLSYFGFIYGIFVSLSTLVGMYRHEKWEIGKCYKTLAPSIARSLFLPPQTIGKSHG